MTPNQAILDGANRVRFALAARRDSLVARQRRGYSAHRARLIDSLGEQYRQAMAIALTHGLEG